MKVFERGHIYQPEMRTPSGAPLEIDATQTITFVNKQSGQEHNGTTTQEVIRILIDRTRHCANCVPHPNNERIVYHLRRALVLHEARALERKTEKGDFEPEYLSSGDDGHFIVIDTGYRDQPNHTPNLIPHRQDWDRECKHPKAPEKV